MNRGAAGVGGFIADQFSGNQFLTSGLLLLVLGWIVTSLRPLGTFLVEVLLRRFFVEIQIREGVYAYPWVLQWIAEHRNNVIASQTSELTVEAKEHKSRRGQSRDDKQSLIAASSEPPTMDLWPGPGLHLVLWKRRLFWIYRDAKLTSGASNSSWGASDTGHSGSAPVLRIYALGSGGAEGVKTFVEEAMQYCLGKDRDKTLIFVVESTYGTGSWVKALARPKRSFDSVILDTDISEALLKDASLFLNRADWYAEHGVPYRRSYLLWGKPGNGKTSMVAALAVVRNSLPIAAKPRPKSFRPPIDDTVTKWLREAPGNAIILLEDIDAAFAEEDDEKDERQAPGSPRAGGRRRQMSAGVGQRVTFSGLLNAIDGIASQEGRIIVMTTNHPERLDPALTRPGRVDVPIEFKLATLAQCKRLFLHFFPAEKDLANDLSKQWKDEVVSMAALQGLFMKHLGDPLAAARELPDVVRSAEATLRQQEAELLEKAEKKRERQEKALMRKKEETERLARFKEQSFAPGATGPASASASTATHSQEGDTSTEDLTAGGGGRRRGGRGSAQPPAQDAD